MEHLILGNTYFHSPFSPHQQVQQGLTTYRNLGVWVGGEFAQSLKSLIPSVAIQGVDPDAYPADLNDYLSEDGGSDAGAASMAQAIEDYASACPKSTIIASGWRYVSALPPFPTGH